MKPSKERLQQTLDFLREHRSNEANFTQIQSRLEEELSAAPEGSEYHSNLEEAREKHLASYAEAREAGGSAWPEFENLIAHFERSVTAAMKEA